MLKSNLTLFISLLCIFALQLEAQTFKAGIVAGFTASQINGDDSAGYNKPGLEGGIKSLVNISKRTDISLEILYSQRGAKDEANADGSVQNIYRTAFIAVPIIYSYKDWEAEDYFRLHFQAGLSYGRLIDAELDNEQDNTAFVEAWRENDLSFLVGATYFVNKKFGLTFRYNRSIFKLYKFDANDQFSGRKSLLAFNLSLHGTYMF